MSGLAIVTGAASGIGQATARALSRDGFVIGVNDLSADGAEAVARAIVDAGGQAIALPGDVSREADVEAMIQGAVARFGPCVVLVNNAGFVQQKRFVDLTPEDFDRMFAVHVRGAFLCTSAVLPGMLARKTGCIVNVASQLGQIGGIELVHYSAAKAAIIGMTKSLAREVSATGVRVNAVAPGPINTPLVLGLSQQWRDAKAAELPLGRFGQADEVASVVSFLVSPAASLFVGQTLGPNSGDVML